MTTYVVAYDISDDDRRTSVFLLCRSYGRRVQYSVFECTLDGLAHHQFRNDLADLLNPTCDRVALYPLCSRCRDATVFLGVPGPDGPISRSPVRIV